MTRNGEASRSALRALEIFEAFRDARRPLSLSEVARLTDMPVSTCHGVFKMLEQRGFLYFGSGRDAYPTRKLWDLAQEINVHDPVALRLEPALTQLRDEVDETVILGVRHIDTVLYLLVLGSSKAIRYSSEAGEHKPLHSSSIGKVLLGAMAPGELDAWLRATPLPKITDRTIVSASRLKMDLAQARARGYYTTHGENVADVMAIAAPLRMGTSTFGVAIAGPLQRLADHEAALGKKLVRALKMLESARGAAA
jgi:IclR family acetate operon transcriptional repressor